MIILGLYLTDYSTGKQIDYGVTFSQKYARELNLDWRKAYLAILDDLKIKRIRLVAYWDLLEKKEGQYNFNDLDWQLNQARTRGAEVVLVIGNRVPRWPECHWPEWVNNLTQEQRQTHLLQLLGKIVERYKNDKVISAWQVENEPFLESFGLCPKLNQKFYQQELELVRQLDNRPIIITESGELSNWFKAAFLSDYIGISVYRVTWNKLWGYFYYPWPPAYYYIKTKMVKLFSPVKDVMVSEMQMEPWTAEPIISTSLKDQYKSMDLKRFRKNFYYVKRTGLSPLYFWGVEWWYWLKEKGYPEIWNEAKHSFNPSILESTK
ncbi:beta-galactosidase [Patescibacteria group bacterium]|nr:beta-galactosidase [Patescibacteria group bacterium]